TATTQDLTGQTATTQDLTGQTATTYRLGYRFDFGDPLDGISLETDPEGLASLNISALFQGIPGWRKWIWEFAMERLNAKPAQAARQALSDLAPAWSASHDPSLSPAAALAQTLASRPDTAIQALTLPTVWPAHLQIHVFVRGSTGRRFLLHIDPACGDAELFSAARRLLFGEKPGNRPWAPWAAAVLADLGDVPSILSWRGLSFGPDPLGTAGLSGSRDSGADAPGACSWFAGEGAAAFQRRLASFKARHGRDSGPKASAGSKSLDGAGSAAAEAKTHAALKSLFSKRLQVMMDAWHVPERPRQETAVLREFLASEWLPEMFTQAYGEEALLRAEKDLPPPRPAAMPKAGSQVKSLASLGQAVTRGGESNAWAGFALCLGAALVSRRTFSTWFRFFAQPPLDSKTALSDLLAKASALPDWEALLLSPRFSAWVARNWEGKLPKESKTGEELKSGGSEDAYQPVTWPGGEAELIGEWNATRDAAERIRKGAKALRDHFCARINGLGQSVAGLPKDIRAALDTLDRNVPWIAKAEAELELELYVNRVAGKSGAVGTVPEAKPDPEKIERQGRQLKDLGGRFKKL
ncbi:MAG: hypothetical protein M3Y08_20880, partial [Fibrobacterota bacterium]|nr:hypothetical protein [Fibrobacterota bacterium]